MCGVLYDLLVAARNDHPPGQTVLACQYSLYGGVSDAVRARCMRGAGTGVVP